MNQRKGCNKSCNKNYTKDCNYFFLVPYKALLDRNLMEEKNVRDLNEEIISMLVELNKILESKIRIPHNEKELPTPHNS